ncbi:MAG: dienelactone hydrolase family protein [Acidimicrobiales bacterium]
MSDEICSEVVTIVGHEEDPVEAYFTRPVGGGSVPGVVVVHHMPGWDEWTRAVTFKLAVHGFAAIAPHLYSRLGPGRWDDLAAAAREQGGVPDAQVVGDIEGAAAYLRSQPDANGKVGVIGFCSGGRHAYLAACTSTALDAAVDCWGGHVVMPPEDLDALQPVSPFALTRDMHCPLLGIFGNDDQFPSPAEVDRIEAELRRYGKDYEFHRYDGAGHGFFATERASYRPEQAVDGWEKVFAFYRARLGAPEKT